MTYDVEKNMTNHPPIHDATAKNMEHLRLFFKNTATAIDSTCPDSREKSLALTNLEQALMWAIASIARNQEA